MASNSISPRALFVQWYAQIWATEYMAGVEGTLCKFFGMLWGHTGPLLGLLWPLGPGEGFPASIPGLGNSVLGQDQAASPCMPWSTSPSHCPGVSPHPVPPTDTAEDWGQNLACGISSWPGSGMFPALSIFSPCLDSPSIQNQPYTSGGLATISAALEPKKTSPYESLLCGRARGGCALPEETPIQPGQGPGQAEHRLPPPVCRGLRPGAFRKRSGWRATSFRGAAPSRGWAPRRVRRTGHTQRKTLPRLAQVSNSRRLSETGRCRGEPPPPRR